ncbi:potassium channel subfamily K member 4-like [Bombyx mandarina]|uniref:Potassium channel subfamily K member 4-like n=1 Tax=Bombyx mandarina TaxID=7092 RepID=A0A6J2K0Z1_BOMMA|nr:potassium channel subfamily K member 4-like [Bombyx mandarina]
MRLVAGWANQMRNFPLFRPIILSMLMASYLAFGASVFQLIEQPIEHRLQEKVDHLKAVFLEKHPCITGQ